MSARRTEVHVEQLVLEGVRPADARVVGEAFEHELARLVHERGEVDGALAGDAGPLSVEARAGESPAALGVRLARTVHGRLST